MRAYSEINDFEEQLVLNRTVLAKFWLQIDKDEQLKRFKLREETSFKRFKITAEDWRNREKWDALSDRGRRHDPAHVNVAGAVDAGRIQRQVLRTHQGAEKRWCSRSKQCSMVRSNR
jgi:hypothetical protein